MALLFTIAQEAFNALPEVIQAEYKQDGEKEGVFHLDVEGAVAKQKVDEFRTNNINLSRERDTLKAQLEAFADVDPDKYKTLVEMEANLKDKKHMTTEEIQELIDRQVNDVKESSQKVIDQLTSERDSAVNGLNGLTIDSDLRKAAKAAGVLPEAMDDVLLRGRQVYYMREGVVTPFENVAQDKVLYGKDGLNPKPALEWMSDLSKTAPHLFKSSDGGNNQQGKRINPGIDTSKLNPLQKIQAGMSQK